MSSQPVPALTTQVRIFLALIRHTSHRHELDRLTYFPSTFCSANNFLCMYWPELFAIQKSIFYNAKLLKADVMLGLNS